MKTTNVFTLFTKKELRKSLTCDSVDEILKTIMTDEKLAHINKITKQENDKRYLAYMLLNYKLQTKGKL